MSAISFRRNDQADYDILINGEAVGTVGRVDGSKQAWVARNSSGLIRSDEAPTRKAAVDALALKVSDAYTVVETLQEIVAEEPVTEQDIRPLKTAVRTLATKLIDLVVLSDAAASEVAALRNELEMATHELENALRAQENPEEPETAPVERPQDLRRTKLRAANVSAYINSSSEIRTSSPERQYSYEGIFVRQSLDEVAVHVDIDQGSHRRYLTDELVKLLEERYIVRKINRDDVNRDVPSGFAIIYLTLKA